MIPVRELSIDPGIGKTNGTGWGEWQPKLNRPGMALVGAGLARLPAEATTDLDMRAGFIIGQLRHPSYVRLIYMEHMQIYPGQRQKGDQNDLLSVAFLEGAIAQHYARAVLYKPREWKGQVPEKTLNRRIEKRLDAQELKVFRECLSKIPPHLHHNVYDATGVGLNAYGRLHTRVGG